MYLIQGKSEYHFDRTIPELGVGVDVTFTWTCLPCSQSTSPSWLTSDLGFAWIKKICRKKGMGNPCACEPCSFQNFVLGPALGVPCVCSPHTMYTNSTETGEALPPHPALEQQNNIACS